MRLRIKDEQGKERLHEFVDAVTTIGRASDNIIQITDEKASRHHFQIHKTDDKFTVEDLGSTNGTRLNGSKIQGSVALKPNDTLVLGKTTFVFEDPNVPPPAAAEANVASVAAGETLEMEPVKAEAAAAPAAPAAALEAEGPKWVLKVIEGKTPGKVYNLGVEALTIGRHSSSTIQIIDEATSNYHAEITREPIGYVLTDLGSTNGTRVRHKAKSEFEKIIKTPLAAGMQIRVGKTLLEFDNIGKPVEDDALFGTISLDPDQLEEKLRQPRRPGKRLKLVAGVALLLVVVGLLLSFLPRDDNGGPVLVPEPITNKVQNGDFEQGTDDEGNPKYFRVERGVPGIKVTVLDEADSGAEKEYKRRLQISKSGASLPSTCTVVETAETMAVEKGKTYELSAHMKNDGDGLFGLRVIWSAGDRQVADEPVVLSQQQEWKLKRALVQAPAWAQRARVGVVVRGKEGAATFDDLSFMEKSSGKPSSYPVMRFAGLELQFEGSKGNFCAEAQGERILEEGTLLLQGANGKIESSLLGAMNAQLDPPEPNRVSYAGTIYDFALAEPTTYAIRAQPGANGVDLTAAADAVHENASTPAVRFYIVGAAAAGEVEVQKGEGTEKLASSQDKTVVGAQGVLFNAGRKPQLEVAFSKPVDVELKREGARRRVTLKFRSEVRLAFSPESLGQKQEMLAALAALNKAIESKNWADVETRVKKLEETSVSKYPDARTAVTRAQQRLRDEWTGLSDELTRLISALRIKITPENGDAVKAAIARHLVFWQSSSKESELRNIEKIVEGILKNATDDKAEKLAQQRLKDAEDSFGSKLYSAAYSYLRAMVQRKEWENTKAVERAKALLPQYEIAARREEELTEIEVRLRALARPSTSAGDFQKAIQVIETHPDYEKNKNDLPEISKLLAEWRKKAQR